MIATLGGLTFVADDTAATYTLDKDALKGWFLGVGMRRESIPRPNAEGDFDLPGYRGPRLITLKGWVIASNPEDYEDAIAALDDLLADGSSDTLSVTSARGTFTAEVRRHAEPDIDMSLYGIRARYLFHVIAADPTKTGPI